MPGISVCWATPIGWPAGREEAIAAFRAYHARSPGFGLADIVMIQEQAGHLDDARETAAQLIAARPAFTVTVTGCERSSASTPTRWRPIWPRCALRACRKSEPHAGPGWADAEVPPANGSARSRCGPAPSKREEIMSRLVSLTFGVIALSLGATDACAQSGNVGAAVGGYSFEDAAKEHPDTKNFHSADGHLTFAVVTPTAGNGFFDPLYVGATVAGNMIGAKILLLGSEAPNPDVAREIEILNQIVQDPTIDGIIMTTPQVGAYDDIVRAAAAKRNPGRHHELFRRYNPQSQQHQPHRPGRFRRGNCRRGPREMPDGAGDRERLHRASVVHRAGQHRGQQPRYRLPSTPS